MTKTIDEKIQPARLEDLPTVLDSRQLMDVLRVNRRDLYELIKSGQLRRLAFHPHRVKVAKDEVRRFLAEQTERGAA